MNLGFSIVLYTDSGQGLSAICLLGSVVGHPPFEKRTMSNMFAPFLPAPDVDLAHTIHKLPTCLEAHGWMDGGGERYYYYIPNEVAHTL